MTQGKIQIGQRIGDNIFPLPNMITPICLNVAFCLGEGMRKRKDQRGKDRMRLWRRASRLFEFMWNKLMNHSQRTERGGECGL